MKEMKGVPEELKEGSAVVVICCAILDGLGNGYKAYKLVFVSALE
jgi:hypothetical protein